MRNEESIVIRRGSYVLLLSLILLLGCTTELDFGEPPRPDYDPLRDGNILPRVVESYPLDGTHGPFENFGTVARLRFNKVMSVASLRRGVHYTSSLSDVKALVLDSADGTTFSIEAVRNDSPARFWWKVGERYVLSVDTTAEDINKNTLPAPFAISFFPEPGFRLLGFVPSDGRADVPPYAESGFFRLEFNSELDTSLLASVHITPPVAGEWHLEDTTLMFYRLEQELGLGTGYTITVDAGAHDRHGHQIVLPASSSFTTQQFQLERTYPLDGMIAIPQTSSIAVRCNAEVDTGSVRSSFSSIPPMAGDFLVEGRQFYFVPASPLRMGSLYVVTLEQSLSSMDGHRLPAKYSFSFQTDVFRVVSISPAHNTRNIPRNTHFEVACNERVRQSSVPGAFNMYPFVPGRFDSCCSGGCSGFEFCYIPSGPLAPNTLYYINFGGRIGNDFLPPIVSVSGNTTVAQWYFFTGD